MFYRFFQLSTFNLFGIFPPLMLFFPYIFHLTEKFQAVRNHADFQQV